MREHKSIMVEKAELVSFKCDKCKKELIDDEFELQEAHSIHFTGGYTSVFGDMNIVECDLCQQCLYELIGDFCVYNYGTTEGSEVIE